MSIKILAPGADGSQCSGSLRRRGTLRVGPAVWRTGMPQVILMFASIFGPSLLAAPALAQATGPRANPFVPLAAEPAAGLTVDPPLADPLRRGAAIIPYRTWNFRILPILGAAAANVSPRAGHLHITVDDLPWRWADTADNGAVVVVGLPPGEHKVRIELATPLHQVLAGQTIIFTIPAPGTPHP